MKPWTGFWVTQLWSYPTKLVGMMQDCFRALHSQAEEWARKLEMVRIFTASSLGHIKAQQNWVLRDRVTLSHGGNLCVATRPVPFPHWAAVQHANAPLHTTSPKDQPWKTCVHSTCSGSLSCSPAVRVTEFCQLFHIRELESFSWTYTNLLGYICSQNRARLTVTNSWCSSARARLTAPCHVPKWRDFQAEMRQKRHSFCHIHGTSPSCQWAQQSLRGARNPVFCCQFWGRIPSEKKPQNKCHKCPKFQHVSTTSLPASSKIGPHRGTWPKVGALSWTASGFGF
jgi:hypothetical protein